MPLNQSLPRCGFPARSTGEPCRRPAGAGTNHIGTGPCKLHLGNTPAHSIRSARLIMERRAMSALWDADTDPITDPLTELAKLAGEVVAWKNIIASRVSILQDIRYEGEKSGEQIRGEVIVLERAMDRCNLVLGTMARLNIDERLARVSELQAQTLADVLSEVLRDMRLSTDMQQEAKHRVATKLRIIAGGQAQTA